MGTVAEDRDREARRLIRILMIGARAGDEQRSVQTPVVEWWEFVHLEQTDKGKLCV